MMAKKEAEAALSSVRISGGTTLDTALRHAKMIGGRVGDEAPVEAMVGVGYALMSVSYELALIRQVIERHVGGDDGSGAEDPAGHGR